ncbi:hypothetical protein CVT24_001714 [Panaeolus cyanescens]|uniref:Uncharacterized protein n=1 Tax=Panaeolus cyanescens TaxID=181874 RepID=A0A409YU98_9AGAR|nr:hypothetical protein CVT24_001714 [Panaeolus cyanescens]
MSSKDYSLVERALIKGKWDPQIPTKTTPSIDTAKLIVDREFKEALTSKAATELFKPASDNYSQSLEKILDLEAKVQNDDSPDAELTRLAIAIACLQAFVQINWTGPDLLVKPLDLVKGDSDKSLGLTDDTIQSKAISELAFAGEPAYHLAKHAAFLRFSQLLLNLPYRHLQTVPWWRLRTSLIHEQVLDDPVSFPEDFQTSLEPLLSSCASEPELVARIYLELGLLNHYQSKDKSAAEYFIKSARSTGLQYELTGALGKRTKFQVTELSQLVLLAESQLPQDDAVSDVASPQKEGSASETHQDDPASTSTTNKLPETLALNDDTLLEQTEFTSSTPSERGHSRLGHIDPSSQPALHPLDQSILLSLCLNVRNTSPSHGLTTEQMSPYVSRVISHPRNWSVHTMALLLRSRLESTRTRTVERSTLQLQALIDQMPTADSTVQERLLYVYSIPLPSKWEMEKELAARYLSLGVVKSALEIFERLEMWEEVVKCYAALEKPEKGISVVRDLLEGRKEEAETVLARAKVGSSERKQAADATREAKLWCILGDLESEKAVEHYQRAWKLSKGTSGRAMRALGGLYFKQEKYNDAIICLNKAVKINPLITRSWFILGCACMRVEDWEAAKDAFARCVAIDEDDGESWNNLASMYLRITKKADARDGSEHATDDEGPSSTEIGINDEKETTADKSSSDNSASLDNGATPRNHSQDSVPFENKLLAFRALKQGLKFSYDNWRMWYNYMIVSMDVGELQEAARALGRIVEKTGEKAGTLIIDEEVLDRLVEAVIRAPADPKEALAALPTGPDGNPIQNPNEGHGLFRPVAALFEKTILPRASAPRVFRAYARLHSWQGHWAEALKAYLDGYRWSMGGTIEKGEQDIEKWREGVSDVEDIVDVLRNFGPKVEGQDENKWRSQARSIVRTFMGRTRDFEEEKEWEKLKELLEELK